MYITSKQIYLKHKRTKSKIQLISYYLNLQIVIMSFAFIRAKLVHAFKTLLIACDIRDFGTVNDKRVCFKCLVEAISDPLLKMIKTVPITTMASTNNKYI